MSLFATQFDAVTSSMPLRVVGQVQGVSGLTIEATDLPLPIGALCRIDSFGGRSSVAEVIGFHSERTLLMPLSAVAGVARGDRIENIASSARVWCSDDLLGRVINGLGEPIDGLGPIPACVSRPIACKSPPPMQRTQIRQPISTSIRAVDALHTCGLGQRMGIFSGPGVGKSTLMSMIAKHTSADVSVVALIGERGREVQEFIHNSLGEEGLKRCVVVVSIGDEPPPLKVRAARIACAVAEHFRDQGRHVMLLMDSITRLAQAQRQIGLAAREPPATKGFPPSVFALLPEILERAGKSDTGSITGFYTVLVEGDDMNEPIPDAVKGITDGHLILSRALANVAHFPAIDVIRSISRVRSDVIDAQHLRVVTRIVALLAVYEQIEDLVNIRAFVPGVNIDFDLAVEARPKITEFLRQSAGEPSNLERAKKELLELGASIDQLERTLRAQQNKAAPRAAAPAQPAMR